MKKLTLFIFCISLLQFEFATAKNDNASPAFDPANVHTSFGIPFDKDLSDDYIIHTDVYSLSYNKNTGSANWVAWNLNKYWFGDVPRFKGKFKKAKDFLPTDFYSVSHDDYTNTGYDRGHMVRSEERTRTDEENMATFYMINILPQTPDLNRGVWLDLEYECENMCKHQNKELYIFAGGIYHEHYKLNAHVEIPDSCFKIIIILDSGQTLKDINEKTEIIAVVMPNEDGIRKDDWEKYITTVDRIEYSTGYDFLHKVPDVFEEKLESGTYTIKIDNKEKKSIKK